MPPVVPHKDQSSILRRAPWITIGLIATNVIIFLITFGPTTAKEELTQSTTALLEYYNDHPYLTLPEQIPGLLTSEQVRKIEETKADAQSSPSAQQIQMEQEKLNGLADAFIRKIGEDPIWKYGHEPTNPYLASFITSMFIHAGIFQLIGNMFFLYLIGSHVEDFWGRPLYLCFYLSTGILVAVIYDLRFPETEIPLAGASGAIAGLAGAFIVRLYRTNITFGYGQRTFQSPAWVIFALWLALQLLLSFTLAIHKDVAFAAPMSGLFFGALFALVIGLLGFEEKYINTYIERRIGTAQNPQFLKALEFSRKSDFVQATNLLKQVVSEQLDHIEAYQELRRIGYANQDDELLSRYSGGLLEALIRKKHHEMIAEVYQQTSTDRVLLPARTLLAMGTYEEEIPNYRSAMDIYQKLTEAYPQDPLALKAYSKQARLLLEKFGDRRSGTELLEKAYRRAPNEEWRSILKSEYKRYDIPIPVDSMKQPSPVLPPTPVSSGELEGLEFHEISIEPDLDITLPNPVFDGEKRGWNLVSSIIENVVPTGLILKNQHDMRGQLHWNNIRAVCVGRIRVMVPGTAKPEKDFLILDLVSKRLPAQESRVLYRIFSQNLNLKKIYPTETSPMGGYRKMIEMILEKSSADCVPDRQQCVGPNFPIFSSVTQYETEMKAKVLAL